MSSIERVLVGYHNGDEIPLDIGPTVAGETVRVFLSDGTEILIEMFERNEAGLDIKVAHRGMVITPIAGNAVRISGGR